MRAARFVTMVTTACTAVALTLTVTLTTAVAAAQTSAPSAKEVAAARKALQRYMAANAPKSEAKPTALDACPWGDNLVADLASSQADYDAAATTAPTVRSSVYVDQSIDKGTRSIPCTAQYTDTAGEPQTLSVVAYADPGLKTAAFAKALARETNGKLVKMNPPSPKLAGGKAESYCVKYSSVTQCSYVWSRDGLYVEIDGPRADSNFTALRNVVLAAVDSMPSLGS